eukprot:9477336-Lingulodinium_polyedra.AAC.1
MDACPWPRPSRGRLHGAPVDFGAAVSPGAAEAAERWIWETAFRKRGVAELTEAMWRLASWAFPAGAAFGRSSSTLAATLAHVWAALG